MRVPATVTGLVLLAACGGGGHRTTFPKGAKVRITDGGQIFDALNTTNCVRWPSEDIKRRAGQSGWGDFRPETGLEGTVVADLAHCDHHTEVVLVAVGERIVPVTRRGVETVKPGPPGAHPSAEIGAALGGDAYGMVGMLEGYGGLDDGVWGGDTYASLGALGGWGYGGTIGVGTIGPVGGTPSSGFNAGDHVTVTDSGMVYDTINQTDCLAWPSDDLKARGGSNAWNGWSVSNGDAGTVLVPALLHCDGTNVIVLVDIGGHIVPMGSTALAPAP